MCGFSMQESVNTLACAGGGGVRVRVYYYNCIGCFCRSTANSSPCRPQCLVSVEVPPIGCVTLWSRCVL